jgi:hypothetical protein
LDPEKQKNKNMSESEVSRELTFTLDAGNMMNVTVMFAAPPMRLLTSEYHLSEIRVLKKIFYRREPLQTWTWQKKCHCFEQVRYKP